MKQWEWEALSELSIKARVYAERFEALKRLLVAKGIITKDELNKAVNTVEVQRAVDKEFDFVRQVVRELK
jgi:hypothetical protein